jgi:hypothetical protein
MIFGYPQGTIHPLQGCNFFIFCIIRFASIAMLSAQFSLCLELQ